MGRRQRFAIGTVLIVALGMTMTSSAVAAPVTIGSPIGGSVVEVEFGAADTILNRVLGEPGAQVTSPISGRIVRWRIAGASGGPFRLRVLTPGPGGVYAGAGTSAPATPTNTQLQTFTTSLPITAGQTIAINNTAAGDKVGAIAFPASGYAKWEPQLLDGQTLAPTFTSPLGAELTFNADVQPAPAVTLINPSSGSVAGGQSVGIAGTDFSEVTKVEFGTVDATSFTVGSDSLITAVAPLATKPGPVDVTVTTIAGKSTTVVGDQFTYTACVVPKLKQKRPKAARKALAKAGCKLGKITRRSNARPKPRVIRQGVKPGDVRPPGTKINIKLG